MTSDSWIEVEDLETHEKPYRSKLVALLAVAACGSAFLVLSLLSSEAEVLVTTTRVELAAPPATTLSANPPPIALGAAFAEAYGRFDVERAAEYLSADADLFLLEGGKPGHDWKLGNRWLRALGFDLQLDSCAMGNSLARDKVRCEFDFHVFGSESWRPRPFVGWFDFNVLGGKISSATLTWTTAAVLEEAWEPFRSWLVAIHPTDPADLYTAEGNPEVTAQSIPLWEERTRQFAEAVRIDDAFVSQVRAICARALARWKEQRGGYDVIAARALDEALIELRALAPAADTRGNQERMIGLVARLANELRNPTSDLVDVLHLVERLPGMKDCTFRGPR